MTRYRGPIVDAHHHFWEPELGRQPWLRPEAAIPFRYGDYASIKRAYLPPDLLRDADGFHLVGSVTMETEWEQDDPIGEMEYTADIAERFGLPNAAVAHAVLRDPDVGGVLERLAEIPLVRAVRNKPGQAASPAEAAANPSLMSDPQWRAGYARLAGAGLHFELQTAWWHVEEAAALAADFPETPIAINHAFLPADRSAEGIAGWTAAVRRMAQFDSVTIKISGIGLRGIPWTAANNRGIVDTIVEAFGPDRVMFASNFPVDSLAGSYSDIFGGFVEITEDWSADEQTAAFIGTAVRVYRLPEELLTR